MTKETFAELDFTDVEAPEKDWKQDPVFDQEGELKPEFKEYLRNNPVTLNQIKRLGEVEETDVEEIEKWLIPTSEQDLVAELQDTVDTVYTGYAFDEETKIEFRGGAISVIAAPTGHGKTTALINFSLGVLEHHPDKAIYFFTYEENRASILSSFLNAYVGEYISENNRRSIKHYFKNIERDPFKYFKKHAADDQSRCLKECFQKKKKQFFEELMITGRLNVIYCEQDANTLFSRIRKLQERRKDVGLICIDYMQLLNTLEKRASRQEDLKHICIEMKNCALETGIPFLVAAQFNREVQNASEMHATKIGEAGDIERIASLIIGLWNGDAKALSKGKKGEGFDEPSTLYLEVLKGRDIGLGYSVRLKYDGNQGLIHAKWKDEEDIPGENRKRIRGRKCKY